ncbi:MAG: Sb-PDE family phosphodiesterase, partial [Pseudomonadota bacterium]
PDIRVEEARRDGLNAVAITEHLEWQPHLDDIPHPDRNRAYEIANAKSEQAAVMVIPGAEITRGIDIEHLNAVFIKDANKLMTPGKTSARNGDEFGERFRGGDEAGLKEARTILEEANNQGAFVFINHPTWTGINSDGRAHFSAFHAAAIKDKLIQGIEVGNGGSYSEDAFRIALDNNLAILGTSDIHGLVAWDYADENEPLVPGGRGARTTTLIITKSATLDGIRTALFNKRTVAAVSNQLYGRQAELTAVLSNALSFSLEGPSKNYSGATSVYNAIIVNKMPIPIVIRNASGQYFGRHTSTVFIGARDTVKIQISALDKPDELITLEVDIMNAYTAPEKVLHMMIPRSSPESAMKAK